MNPLNLEDVEIPKEAITSADGTYLVWVLLAIGVTIGLILLLSFLCIKRGRGPIFNVRLSTLPISFKAIITLCLVAFALTHLFGGLDVYVKTRVIYSSAKDYFFYMKLGHLLNISHAHLFAHAVMYGLVGSVFALSRVPLFVQIPTLIATLLGSLLDVLSWWAMKYISADFEWFSIFCGILFGTGFLMMMLVILYELWPRKEPL